MTRRATPALSALAIGFLIAAGPAAWAQSAHYRFVRSDEPLRDRNAYLLTLIASDPAARQALASDPALVAVGARLATTLPTVMAACRIGEACPVDRLMLTDAEIETAGGALARLTGTGGPLKRLVDAHMRPSGLFQKYAGESDPALIRSAWQETARGINRLYRVYALGEKPNYPEIDSMARDPAGAEFRGALAAAFDDTLDTTTNQAPFFALWSRLGSDLLIVDQRDNAVRFEPLETGENAAAFARARRLTWSAHRYSAILVPGAGLEAGETGLSPVGEFRIRLAAKRWREGLAPFIIVSGGYVHPDHTPFAEAIEMRRALVGRYGVPAEAIVIDPYARHTTTNLRNAARLLFRMGAPSDKPLVITSTQDQSAAIASAAFAARCAKELGYQPVLDIKRLSPFDLTARISLVSLHADIGDPLDP